jgi:hypothetical protein
MWNASADSLLGTTTDAVIAAQLGVGATAVRARRIRLGITRHVKPIKHGTVSAYKGRMCKCAACTDAHRRDSAARKKRRPHLVAAQARRYQQANKSKLAAYARKYYARRKVCREYAAWLRLETLLLLSKALR